MTMGSQPDNPTFVSDTNGGLITVNQAVIELTGYDRTVLLENGLPDISAGTASEAVREHIERTVTGASAPLTTTLKDVQDRDIRVELTSQLVEVDGKNCVRTIANALSEGTQSASQARDDVVALRQFNQITADAEEFDQTTERLLSLGCDRFGLDTGILSRIDGGDYEVAAVVDATESHEAGAVYNLKDTICDATLANGVTGTLAFADIEDTDYQSHPAAESVRAYIGAPVVVDGDTYGTVNFSMKRSRSEAFQPEELEFVKIIAQWLGTEIERQNRIKQLEQYETVLEAVDDPVYLLDGDWQFTFFNEAAERKFGLDSELIGRKASAKLDTSVVERTRKEVEGLIAGDSRLTTTELELETVDNQQRIVENRLALIGDEELRGAAGVLIDVTDRKKQQRRLESFQQAVEEATDGIAILDGDEYIHVDQSHVEMYGFEEKEELLGNTWRELYSDDEVERLEQEAFSALEADGYWRGMVTGSRPDGSTFPVELSLTIIDDGRLVCTVRDETEHRKRKRELESFQQAVESARDGVAVLDDGEYTYIDQSHIEMYGFEEKEELLGNTWRELYSDDEVDRLEQEAFPALEADGYWRGMVTGSRPDGSTFPAELSLTIIDDGRLVCTVRDETKRRKRKRELESQSAAIEAASDGIALLDNDRQYTYVNEAHVDSYGYDSPEAFIGESWRICYSSGECARIESDIMPQLSEHGEWRGEATGRRKDGTTFSQEVSLTSFEHGFICVIRDISARKARERELELKEHAMDEANVGIQITDPTQEDNPLVYVNDGFERITGYAREDVLGRNPRFLQGKDTDTENVAQLREAIEADEPVSLELQNQRCGGTTYWSRLSVTPVKDTDGTVTNYIGIQQDVSERREIEMERKARVEVLQRIYEVTTDPELSLDEKIMGLLEAGKEHLNLPYGFLTRIERGDELETGTQTIDEALGSHELLQPGESVPIEQSYCRKTIEQDDLLELTHTAETQWANDKAYETWGLETYIGTEVIAGDDLYGTLCFASKEPYGGTFDDFKRSFIRLAGRWLGYEINRRNTRAAIQRQREQFRLLIESVDEYAFFIAGEDGMIKTWNGGTENLFGYDTETAVGMPIAELHLEADQESGLHDRLLKQARISGESAHEGWHVRADGSEFYADVRYAPLEAEDGEFRGYATIVRDMTDRRRQQRRTERFVEESDDVITIVDPDGTVAYVSGSAENILGYDPDTLIDENLFDYVHPDSRERAMEAFFAGVEVPGESFKLECRVKSGDNEWLNVEGQCRNMLDDSAINGMLLYLRNVTESKERSRRFESIFNQTFQFTGLLEPDGTVIEANDAALDFGGVERDTLVGSPLADAPWLAHSEATRDDVVDAIERAANGEFVRYETEARGADGLAAIDFSVKPVTDDDNEVSMLVVEGRDITALQQHKRHLEVMQRVMRHNMRNDITKMRGWTQVISEEPDAEKRAEHFEAVEQVLNKWESITEKMRDIRTVFDSQQWQEVRREAEVVVEDAVAPVREEYAAATVLTDVSDSKLQMPMPLLDAIRELVENSAKASMEATIEVEVGRLGDGWSEVVVRDDGGGMPDMEADVLENGEETPLNHGQGIGLWMVRVIVTQAGGDVSVESTDDGTIVRLRLPAKQTTESESPAEGPE